MQSVTQRLSSNRFSGTRFWFASEEIERVERLYLRMPKALWVTQAKNFGRPIISIDIQGNNLFDKNRACKSRKEVRQGIEVLRDCSVMKKTSNREQEERRCLEGSLEL